MFCVRGRRMQWRQLWRRHKTFEMTIVTMMKTHKITTITANTPDTWNDHSLAEDTWNSDSKGEYTRHMKLRLLRRRHLTHEMRIVTAHTQETWNDMKWRQSCRRHIKWRQLQRTHYRHTEWRQSCRRHLTHEMTIVTANTQETWNDDSLSEDTWNNDSYSEYTRQMKWRQLRWIR